VLLAIMIVIALLKASTWDQIREVLEIFVPVVAGLAGTAFGYYLTKSDE